ncbi:MAG: hypothetical protein ABIK15_07105 [Pseudomonadota bacterium]
MDLPHYKSPYYTHNLDLGDYLEIADTLKHINGQFILTINDTPKMQDVFKNYRIEAVELDYSAARDKLTVGRELLISNFEPKVKPKQLSIF